jgi:hypothetical protein
MIIHGLLFTNCLFAVSVELRELKFWIKINNIIWPLFTQYKPIHSRCRHSSYFRPFKILCTDIKLYLHLLENSLGNVKWIKKLEKVWLFFITTFMLTVERQISWCISNLIYIASCFFIPSQYDVYWLQSNTALSGATSECHFHNRNIFIH